MIVKQKCPTIGCYIILLLVLSALSYNFIGWFNDLSANLQIASTNRRRLSDAYTLPTVLHSHASAIYEDTLFVVGGWGGQNHQAAHFISLDPVSNMWDTAFPSNDFLYQLQGDSEVQAGNLIYIIAPGNGLYGNYDDAMLVYNLSVKQYVYPHSTQPLKISGACAVSDNIHTIYVIGGFWYSMKSYTQKYNIDDKNWSRVADTNIPLRWQSCAMDETSSYIFMFGGIDNYATLDRIEKYSVNDNTWTNLANIVALEQPRQNHVCRLLGRYNNIYCIGGRNSSGGQLLNSVEVFDPSNHSITTLNLQTNINGVYFGAVVWREKCIIITGGVNSDAVEHFCPGLTFDPTITPTKYPSKYPSTSPSTSPSAPPTYQSISSSQPAKQPTDYPTSITTTNVEQIQQIMYSEIAGQADSIDNLIRNLLIIVSMILFVIICIMCFFMCKLKQKVNNVEKRPHNKDVREITDAAQIGNLIENEEKQEKDMVHKIEETDMKVNNYSAMDNTSDKSDIEELYVKMSVNHETKMEIEMLQTNISGKKNRMNYGYESLKSWFHSEVNIPNYNDIYYQLFIDNGYDTLDIVQMLNEDELSNINITKRGHIKKIMMEINNLKYRAQYAKTEGKGRTGENDQNQYVE